MNKFVKLLLITLLSSNFFGLSGSDEWKLPKIDFSQLRVPQQEGKMRFGLEENRMLEREERRLEEQLRMEKIVSDILDQEYDYDFSGNYLEDKHKVEGIIEELENYDASLPESEHVSDARVAIFKLRAYVLKDLRGDFFSTEIAQVNLDNDTFIANRKFEERINDNFYNEEEIQDLYDNTLDLTYFAEGDEEDIKPKKRILKYLEKVKGLLEKKLEIEAEEFSSSEY